MFRAMLDQGMETLALPSAFTAVTGQAHWEILVRARAVENVCFVIAAAQGGRHVNGRQTHGESMIVDPWGTVLGRLEKGPGLVVAEVDSGRVTELRHRFPALRHRRFAGRMAED
jgi:nitrilase